MLREYLPFQQLHFPSTQYHHKDQDLCHPSNRIITKFVNNNNTLIIETEHDQIVHSTNEE